MIPSKVVAMIGSSRNGSAFAALARRLNIGGHVAIRPGLFWHGDPLADGKSPHTAKAVQDALTASARKAIDVCDVVYVVNPGDGRIGWATRMDIEYAESVGKDVVYMMPPKGGEEVSVDKGKIAPEAPVVAPEGQDRGPDVPRDVR